MMTDRTKWDKRMLQLANEISLYSKDRSTKVGAIIVGPDGEIRSTGYNGFPRNVDDDVEHRHERPTKYLFAEHGERNAIYNAARVGIPTKGCTLYVTSNPSKFPPCADCARAIIQSGITRVVQERLDHDSEAAKRWKESSTATFEMFAEAGIEFCEVDL
jgi:dCMP deaminase